MYKLASQEIDFHDRASFLETLAEKSELPDFVKKAAAVERGSIPLDKFALVIVTEHGAFPKFALHNKAYTWISSRLFGKTASKLPPRGAQIAASHIKQACTAWGVDCPAEVTAFADPVSPVTSNMYELSKQAGEEEPHNSVLDYNKYRVGFRGEPSKELLKQKLMEFMNYDGDHATEAQQIGEELAARLYAWAMNDGYCLPSPESLAGMVSSNLPKEISDRSEVKQFFLDKMERIDAEEKVKRASAIVNELGKNSMGIGSNFPMHTPELVKRAEEYFHDNFDRLAPKHRKELATNIVKNASEHGLFVKDEGIRKYAGSLFSRGLQGNVMARKSVLLEKNAADVLDQLYERRNVMGPENFAAALEEFDKQAGIADYWGKHIKDPYMSTFEITKVAQWSFRQGQDVINEEQLREFVDKHIATLHGYINDHIIRDLKTMPIEIFDSLPRPEKEIIIAKMEEAGVA